jgi:hypothetical protein
MARQMLAAALAAEVAAYVKQSLIRSMRTGTGLWCAIAITSNARW